MIRRGLVLFSPMIVFTITWFVTIGLYLLNPFQLDTVSIYTWFVIFAGLSMVYAGFYTAKMLSEGFVVKLHFSERGQLPFSLHNIQWIIIILSTISLIGRFGTSYMVYTQIGGIEKYLLEADAVRKFLVQTAQGNTGVNMVYYKIFSYLGSFTTIAVVLAGAVSNLKKSKLLSVYPLLVAAFHSVVTLQRVYFVKHYVIWMAVSFIIIYFYPTSEQKEAIKKFIRSVITFIFITFIFVTVVVVLRHLLVPGSQLSKIINNFYFYIAGNIFWLDKYLMTDPDVLHGTSILRSFVSWFARFGLIEEGSIMSPHYEFYKLYDTLGNTFTYLRIPYEDFSIAGVVIYSYVWGWSAFYILKKYLEKFSLVRLYLAALLIYSFFWSFFGFGLTAITTIVWKAFLFFLVDHFFLHEPQKRQPIQAINTR